MSPLQSAERWGGALQDLPELSGVAEAYLDKFRQLDPDAGYTLVYSNGYELGQNGFSREFPALSLDLALFYLEQLLRMQGVTSERECNHFVIRPVSASGSPIKARFILQVDASIRDTEQD